MSNDATCGERDPDVTYDDIEMMAELPLTIVFDHNGGDTATVDVTVCADNVAESTEYIIYEIDDSQDHLACAGDTATTTLTITDDDRKCPPYGNPRYNI